MTIQLKTEKKVALSQCRGRVHVRGKPWSIMQFIYLLTSFYSSQENVDCMGDNSACCTHEQSHTLFSPLEYQYVSIFTRRKFLPNFNLKRNNPKTLD